MQAALLSSEPAEPHWGEKKICVQFFDCNDIWILHFH
uniref:Uncharacterized protein n=1 Tax=Arundo donax TaxID=35708 RepID=A0A0A9ENE1_ARUDO